MNEELGTGVMNRMMEAIPLIMGRMENESETFWFQRISTQPCCLSAATLISIFSKLPPHICSAGFPLAGVKYLPISVEKALKVKYPGALQGEPSIF